MFIVSNPNEKFRILINGGDEFNYDGSLAREGANQKHRFSVIDNTVKIFGLTPQLSENEMKVLWPHGVGVAKNETLAVSTAYDIEPMTLSGHYTINGDTVSDHYFEYGTPIRGLIFTFGVIGLYLTGATIKGIIRFIRWRKKRSEIIFLISGELKTL